MLHGAREWENKNECFAATCGILRKNFAGIARRDKKQRHKNSTIETSDCDITIELLQNNVKLFRSKHLIVSMTI